MYIETIPNRDSPPAVLLRESRREGKKIRKVTLANLSHLSLEKIQALRAALSGQGSFNPDTVVCGPIWATLDILKQLAKKLMICSTLGSSSLAKLVEVLIFARIAHQGSRLSTVRWAQDHCVEQLLDVPPFDEDDLYDALDWLALEQNKIENKLYRHYLKKHGTPPVLVLYDVTSSYFEGECNELAYYGYNRDGKKGKKQIVIGLLTAPDGDPLSVQVFDGNTTDTQTFEDQITKCVERFSISDVVFVGDRGMIKAHGKQACKQVNFSYITALTDPQIRTLLKSQVLQPNLFDKTVVEVEWESKRLVLRCDPNTKSKEGHRREDKLKKLSELTEQRNEFVRQSKRADPETGLANLQRWAKSHKISSFVNVTLDKNQLLVTSDPQAKQKDELLDGCYVLETDVDSKLLDSQAVHDRYKDLQKVERDFRTMKTGLLDIRPIFLRNANRTRAHVFISMLALKIVREMESLLRAQFQTTHQNPYTITLDNALSALSRICLLSYTLGKQALVSLPKPDSRQQAILDALKLTLTPPAQAP